MSRVAKASRCSGKNRAMCCHSPSSCKAQRLSTSLSPSSTRRKVPADSIAMRSVSIALSTVINWETLITESLGSVVSLLRHWTFPGASARRRFEVITATMTVRIRLSLNSSACMTRTGRLYPGPAPVGSGRAAHHTSPRRITNLPGAERAIATVTKPGRDQNPPPHRWHRASLSHLHSAGWQ